MSHPVRRYDRMHHPYVPAKYQSRPGIQRLKTPYQGYQNPKIYNRTGNRQSQWEHAELEQEGQSSEKQYTQHHGEHRLKMETVDLSLRYQGKQDRIHNVQHQFHQDQQHLHQGEHQFEAGQVQYDQNQQEVEEPYEYLHGHQMYQGGPQDPQIGEQLQRSRMAPSIPRSATSYHRGGTSPFRVWRDENMAMFVEKHPNADEDQIAAKMKYFWRYKVDAALKRYYEEKFDELVSMNPQKKKKSQKKRTTKREEVYTAPAPNIRVKPIQLTPYTLWCREKHMELTGQGSRITFADVARMSGDTWNGMSEQAKQRYYEEYEQTVPETARNQLKPNVLEQEVAPTSQRLFIPQNASYVYSHPDGMVPEHQYEEENNMAYQEQIPDGYRIQEVIPEDQYLDGEHVVQENEWEYIYEEEAQQEGYYEGQEYVEVQEGDMVYENNQEPWPVDTMNQHVEYVEEIPPNSAAQNQHVVYENVEYQETYEDQHQGEMIMEHFTEERYPTSNNSNGIREPMTDNLVYQNSTAHNQEKNVSGSNNLNHEVNSWNGNTGLSTMEASENMEENFEFVPSHSPEGFIENQVHQESGATSGSGSEQHFELPDLDDNSGLEALEALEPLENWEPLEAFDPLDDFELLEDLEDLDPLEDLEDLED